MEPTLILFDVDGTLVETGGAGRAALLRAFATTFGARGVAAGAAEVRFAGMTDPAIIAALGRAAGIDEAQIQALGPALETCYLQALADEMERSDPRRRVLPGTLDLLETLTDCPGVHLGLVTGNVEQGARRKLEPFGLNRFFPGGGFGSDHADRREIARIAVVRLSASTGVRFAPGRVTVVGDTELDVDCARSNGYRAVAVATGWVPRATLEAARPDALFDELGAGPDVLAALGVTPGALRDTAEPGRTPRPASRE